MCSFIDTTTVSVHSRTKAFTFSPFIDIPSCNNANPPAMKKILRLSIFLSVAALSASIAQAQTIQMESSAANQAVRKAKSPLSPAYLTAVSPQSEPCITDEARMEVRQEIAANKAEILQANPNAFSGPKGSHPLFVWPIKSKDGFDDYGYYTVNFLVDHNPNPGVKEDYHCGTRTYDWPTGNHEGTDLILWPYPWKHMQEEVMEIVAAAAGTIVDKRDGNFDLNCDNDGDPNWNGIVIEHSDGSQAWYWHFKSGAITGKSIGDMVTAGEYLGAAGSSGSSDWPHLHFEVHDTDGNLIDPWEGPCNDMNATSWWEEQQNYVEPNINHISTHYTISTDNVCPEVENTYEETQFAPGDSVIMRLHYRDLQNGATTHFVVTAPDGTVYYDWNFVSQWQDYATASANWVFLPASNWQMGTYQITADFGGNTFQTHFTLSEATSVDEHHLADFRIQPNPASDRIHIVGLPAVRGQFEIRDLTGRLVSSREFDGSSSVDIDVTEFSPGIYLLVVIGQEIHGVRRFVVNR